MPIGFTMSIQTHFPNFDSIQTLNPTTLYTRNGFAGGKLSSIYYEKTRNRMWFINSYGGYTSQFIQYINLDNHRLISYYTYNFPQWWTLNRVNKIFPTCNLDTCSMVIDENRNMLYFSSNGLFYYFNLTHYELVDPREVPHEFTFNLTLGNKAGT